MGAQHTKIADLKKKKKKKKFLFLTVLYKETSKLGISKDIYQHLDCDFIHSCTNYIQN